MRAAGLAVLLAFSSAACASWRPRLGESGTSVAQWVGRDFEECWALAYKSGGGSAWLQGLDIGLFGGGYGAGVGAFTAWAGDESPSGGAWIGASVGALLGVWEGFTARAQFKRAYRNCMQGRGHEVPHWPPKKGAKVKP